LRFTRRRFLSGPEDKIQHPHARQALAEIQILVDLTLLLSIAMLSSLGLTPQLSEYLTVCAVVDERVVIACVAVVLESVV
jgi:hypothetical protein